MGKIELCYLHRDTLTPFERFTFILFFSNLLRKQFCLFLARQSLQCCLRAFLQLLVSRATLWLWCPGFLTVVASLFAEHRFYELWLLGSGAVAQ